VKGRGSLNVMTNVWLEDDSGRLYEVMVWHYAQNVNPPALECRRYFTLTFEAPSTFNLSDVLARSINIWESECGVKPTRLIAVEFGVEVRDEFAVCMEVTSVSLASGARGPRGREAAGQHLAETSE